MSAAVSTVLVGGYLAFKPVDGRSIAQATEAPRSEPCRRPPRQISPPPSGQTGQHLLAVAGADVKFEAKLPDAEAPTAPVGVAAAATTGMASASPVAPPARDVAIKDVNYYRERGMSAYHAGDLIIALANFDLAIDMDPGLPNSYINRGIVFHRMGDLKRALSDVAEAKRIENSMDRTPLHGHAHHSAVPPRRRVSKAARAHPSQSLRVPGCRAQLVGMT